MAPYKALLNFKKKGDSVFDTFIHGVQTGLTNNPRFPAPPVSIADYSKAADDYTIALTVAKGGGKINVSMKDDARQVVEDMLVSIVQYVNYASGGDKTAILSTGLSVSVDRVVKRTVEVAAAISKPAA